MRDQPKPPNGPTRKRSRSAALIGSAAFSAPLLLASPQAFAVPGTVPFVAQVESATGPLPENIEVDATLTTLAGTPLWGFTFVDVPVQGGVFRLELGGAGSPAFDAANLPAEGARLSLAINGIPLDPPLALGSVPYALRAQDAETLAGLAPAAFVTPSQLSNALHPVAFSGNYADLEGAPGGGAGAAGTAGRLALFTGASTLGDSVLAQNGLGQLGIGTTTPAGALDIRGAGTGSLVISSATGLIKAVVGFIASGAGRVQVAGANNALNATVGPSLADPDWGLVEIADPSGVSRARLTGGVAGAIVEVLGATGQRLARIGQAPAAAQLGYMAAASNLGEDRAIVAVAPGNWGYATTLAPSGGTLVQQTTLGSNTSRGYLSVDQGGTTSNTRVALYADGNGSGFANTLGPNNQLNTASGPTPSNANHGSVGVYNSIGQVRAAMLVNDAGLGVVLGDIKSFRMQHPDDPSRELWYASLEGPEAGAYVRGTADLVDGRAIVKLPEHFRLVASPHGLTAVVTPLSAESEGLAVIHKTPDRIEVVELRRGRGSYAFDYAITAVRRGFEDFEVNRPALGEPVDLRALPAAPPSSVLAIE